MSPLDTIHGVQVGSSTETPGVQTFTRASIDGGRREAGELAVLHIVAGLYAFHGGPSYSVPSLTAGLARQGVSVLLASVAQPRAEQSYTSSEKLTDLRTRWDYANLPLIGGLRISSGLSSTLRFVLPQMDVVHNHGLWLWPNLEAGWQAARAGKPLIVSPRGMLDQQALSFSRWRKRLVWRVAQGAIVRAAACLHATSEQEYREIRNAGLANPVAIIPNGIDLPKMERASATGSRVALSLGRVHPIKGLDRLIRAWALAAAPDWRLRIVGPAEQNHDQELRALVRSLGLTTVTIEPAVYGEKKGEILRRADLFILSTLNENFAISVAEALAAGIPAISTKGAPWSGLVREGCGWWIDHGVEPLTAALREAMALPPEIRREMGSKGRAWMERDFTWDAVARDMKAVYAWVCNRDERPACVRID